MYKYCEKPEYKPLCVTCLHITYPPVTKSWWCSKTYKHQNNKKYIHDDITCDHIAVASVVIEHCKVFRAFLLVFSAQISHFI